MFTFIKPSISIIILSFMYLISCSSSSRIVDNTIDNSALAEVISVKVNGKEQHYTFSVGIKSPDLGCKQYANWWEVVSPEGKLIYRRILGHSHVNEQPFIRSGGKVKITKDQIVIIRAHMNTSKFGVKVFKGSIKNGFESYILKNDFAIGLENRKPLPTGCAF